MAQKQSEGTQLVPPEVFIGDKAHITFTFNSSAPFPTNENSAITLEEGDTRLIQTADYSLVSAVVSKKQANGEYTAQITFIPWKIGILNFSPINIGTEKEPFFVQIPAPIIHSIAEKINSETLRPPAPPLLIPGTTYVVYGITLGTLLIFTVLVLILVKITAFSRAIVSFAARLKLSRNYKRLQRHLRRLEKKVNAFTPLDFAEQLEKLLRSYFCARYTPDFASATAKESLLMLVNADSGEKAVSLAKNILTCCNFIRFCAPEEKKLAHTERIELVKQAAEMALECENAPV